MSLIEFWYDLIEDFQIGEGLVECSRLDMQSDGERNITLFLRTQPSLSARMWNVEPYQYPMSFLYNQRIVIKTIQRHLDEQRAILWTSELTSMALTHDLKRYGATIDQREEILFVPVLRPARSEALQWREVIGNLRYQNLGAVAAFDPIVLHVVHIPDEDVSGLDDQQWRHIASLSLGWNVLGTQGDNPPLLIIMADQIKVAAEHALPIVAYS